jgi:predicted AAA+ superfamily ATPase
MKRLLLKYLEKDLNKKILLLSGPRQCGKTTLARMLGQSLEGKASYLNFDYELDREVILKKTWDRSSSLLIFDEIHKMHQWKRWLKGIYDVEQLKPPILVTGSAKLDTLRKVGDSLAGRYFSFRLHPLDIHEVAQLTSETPEVILDKLLQFSSFPEPYFTAEKEFYMRWRKTHMDIIIKQDLISLENIRNITGIENLILIMRERVGSTISHANIARDLAVDTKTVIHWLDILERMFVLFKVTPYSKKVTNSLLKAPKYYFYDTASIKGDDGAKLENLVACALLKQIQFLEDTKGLSLALHFLRDKTGREIDFCVVKDEDVSHLIEVKWGDAEPAPSFTKFKQYFPKAKMTQIVRHLTRNLSTENGIAIKKASEWLKEMPI